MSKGKELEVELEREDVCRNDNKHGSCGCQKFQHRIGHVPIREKGEYGPDLCVWGMLSPRLDSKCGRSLRG
jgi:hypothetical protein